MSMNVLAIAGNFFLSIEVLEKIQVVCGMFWIELFLSYWKSWNMRVGSSGFHL